MPFYDDDVPFDTEEAKEDADVVTELYETDTFQPGKELDVTTANYFVGLIKKNQEKSKQYEDQAKEMKEDFKFKVDNWLRKRQRALEYSNQMLLMKLEGFYQKNQPSNGKPISLPEGNVGFYKVREKYDFDTNEKEIVDKLEKNGLEKYLSYKPSIKKKDLKEACSFHDGNVYIGDTMLPEASYTPGTTEFKVR